jgi:hypothetical protein
VSSRWVRVIRIAAGSLLVEAGHHSFLIGMQKPADEMLNGLADWGLKVWRDEMGNGRRLVDVVGVEEFVFFWCNG